MLARNIVFVHHWHVDKFVSEQQEQNHLGMSVNDGTVPQAVVYCVVENGLFRVELKKNLLLRRQTYFVPLSQHYFNFSSHNTEMYVRFIGRWFSIKISK